ncbi:MAG TPA: trigger factor [Polyangiales bacterium]
MQSQIETLSPVLVSVKVEVPWKKVAEDLEAAYRATQRTARIRGFRPGKVPRDVVKNMMGKSIRVEVAAELVRQGIGHAVEEHKIEPVAYAEELAAPTIKDGEALTFTAKIEVRPKIESVDTTGLLAERTTLVVDDSAVQAEIERMREQTAELSTPETARPARAGDTLTVDLTVSIDGEPKPEMGGQDRRIELGTGRLLPDLEAGLMGVEVGAHKDITLTFPADYGYEALRGKSALFHVQVKNLQQKVLAEIDDELAKDLGHDSLSEMRKTIRERLEKTAAERADALVREQILEKLIDKNPVPVPPSMIDQETRSSLEQYLRIQYMLGQQVPFTEEMHKEFRDRAERKIRAGLLFGAIAKAESISVSDADFDAKLQELAERSGKHVAKVRAEHQGDEKRTLELQILEKKLLEYLVSRATISDVAEPAATEPAATEPAKQQPKEANNK